MRLGTPDENVAVACHEIVTPTLGEQSSLMSNDPAVYGES
jgi:hypothetical protein